MKIHELKSINKGTTRIGRGGKRGTTSGRGQKGQKSRSGHRIRPAMRDLVIRLPKLRGFRNKPKADVGEVFNLGTLSVYLKAHAKGNTLLVVNRELLKAAGLIKKDYKGDVKILGNGEVKFPMSVVGCHVSKSARTKIEKAGGKVGTKK